jgi:hypothetical protein
VKYLVSGASSYLGSSYIKNKDEYQFVEIVNNYKLDKKSELHNIDVPRIIPLDLLGDKQEFDCIIHFAASALKGNTSWFDLGKTLIDVSVRQSIPIILIGTWWQFHHHYRTIEYTKLKILEQNYLIDKANKDCNYAICILGDVYGPFDPRNKIINQIIESSKKNKVFELINPNGIMNPTYIENMLDRIEYISKSIVSKLIFQEKISMLNAEWYYSSEILRIIQQCFDPVPGQIIPKRNTPQIIDYFDENFFSLKRINYPETSLKDGIMKILTT